ncbi:hypothetical protein [Rhodococcus olei]|uniref:hypothetical protein n=1 Tax=Rhodococcus olei TaxID=2161675 RepID=UPI0031EB2F1C
MNLMVPLSVPEQVPSGVGAPHRNGWGAACVSYVTRDDRRTRARERRPARHPQHRRSSRRSGFAVALLDLLGWSLSHVALASVLLLFVGAALLCHRAIAGGAAPV